MFLRKTSTTIKGKKYDHYKIVESYRKDGNVKQRTVLSLGNITEEKAEKIKLALSIENDPDIIVARIDDLEVTDHKAYLDIAFLYHLWQKWGFNTFFNSDHWVSSMVLNRIIEPGSKITVKDWAVKTVLPALTANDVSAYNEFDVYRQLDKLNQCENELQLFLYNKIREESHLDGGIVFYDITSSYFEGSTCILSEYGYSRDNRPDHEQITIALMVSSDGYPFYWKVLKGNTQDVITVKGLVDEVRDKFHIDSLTMVFDRGMSSEKNLDYINDNELNFITALGSDEIRSMEEYRLAVPEPVEMDSYDITLSMNEFLPADENNLMYYREFIKNGKRYILGFNVQRFLLERKAYEEKIADITEWFSAKNIELRTMKSGRQYDVIVRQIKSAILRKKLKKIISFSVIPITIKRIEKNGRERDFMTYEIQFKIHKEAELDEMRMHGLWCFLSNVPDSTISACEIIDIYGSKNKVEEAFHEIKSHINIRPILLSRAERVKAHVTVCVLAYFLYNDIEMMLKEKNVNLSPEYLLKKFSKCMADKVGVRGGKYRYNISRPDSDQQDILNTLGLNMLIEEKYYSKIMKKLV